MMMFNRYKHTRVEKVDEQTFKVFSAMCDTFHEISIELVVDVMNDEIKAAHAEFLRQPNIICTETAGLIQKLVGVKLSRGITKNANELIGGPSGCTHLADLVLEAAKAYIQGKFRKQFEDAESIEKAREELHQALRGTCWYHTRQ